MNKVFILGDCHASRVWEHHDPDTCPIELVMWGKAGTKIFGLDLNQMGKENTASSGYEAPTKARTMELINSGFKYVPEFNDYKDTDVIMLWLGYIDVRLFFPKYKNPDEIAKQYVDLVTTYFVDKKIRFIEPLPQWTEMLLKYEGISASYEYSERLEQNELFIESLRKYSKMAGLMEPVSQDAIKQAIGKEKLTPDMAHKKAPHPVDGLQDEYNERIYNLFVDEAIKTLSFYNS